MQYAIEESESFHSIQISSKKSPGALSYAQHTEFSGFSLFSLTASALFDPPERPTSRKSSTNHYFSHDPRHVNNGSISELLSKCLLSSEIRQNPPMCTFVVKTWKFKELLSHDSSVFRKVCIAKIPNSFLKFQDFHGIATDRRIEPFSLERRHLQGTGIQLEIRPVIHMARSCKFTMKTKQNCILLDGFLEVKNLIRCESGI